MKKQENRSVGIFFVINNKVIANLESISILQPLNGFYDAELGHSEWFEETLFAKYPQFEQYIEIPRGRVVYEIKKNKFIVYLDKKLNNEQIQKKIMKSFGLTAQNTLFRRDAHYTTDLDDIDKLFS
jgi:hypothetical protein